MVSETATAQFLVSALGAVHALSNALSAWQGMKGAFAFLGNRKGRLTPQLNAYILDSISATCGTGVAGPVKDHVLQRSKQVKAGIKAVGGKKNFDGFGRAELAAFAGTAFNYMDLTEVCAGSVALKQAQVDGMVRTHQMERKNTTDWETVAKNMLREMVNPVEEE